MLRFSKPRLPLLLTSIRYNFIPPSCYDISAKPNPVICVTLGNEEGAFCDLHFRVLFIAMQLFENIVPKTAENYKRLLLGTGSYKDKKLSLINSSISRYVPRAFFQFGNMENGNYSIFGPKFRDESFELLHDRPGLLTSLSEENTNNSRFALTLSPAPYMDLKNVVFGEVTADTFGNLRELEKMGTRALALKILNAELLKVPEHHDEHHEDHGHEHHGHEHGADHHGEV